MFNHFLGFLILSRCDFTVRKTLKTGNNLLRDVDVYCLNWIIETADEWCSVRSFAVLETRSSLIAGHVSISGVVQYLCRHRLPSLSLPFCHSLVLNILRDQCALSNHSTYYYICYFGQQQMSTSLESDILLMEVFGDLIMQWVKCA